MPICNCQVHCRGGKDVSTRTYARHERFRNSASDFSPEFGAFMAAASASRYVSIIPRTSGLVYDFREKQNFDPSGSGDDLDASESLAAQVEDEEDGNEEPNDVDIIDDQVSFFTHHNESNNIEFFLYWKVPGTSHDQSHPRELNIVCRFIQNSKHV
jgi:hypothetical protein